MSFWTWTAVAFMSGIVVYLLAGVLVGPSLPPHWRRRIADHYFQQSAYALGRGLLVRRKHGGYDLVSTTYDAGKEAERTELDGEEKFWKDPYGFMTRFYNVPFGLAHEAHNVIGDPRLAEIGEMEGERYASNAHTKVIEREVPGTDGPETQGIVHYARHLAVPRAMRLVDPAQWSWIMPGGADPKDAKTVEEWTVKSQEGYNTRKAMKYMIILMAYGAGLGGVWFIVKYGGVAGGAPQLPIGTVSLLGVVL